MTMTLQHRSEAAKKRKAFAPIKMPANGIDWDEAVREGRELLTTISTCWWQLGELADRVKADYGKNKLAQFAKEIGMCSRTLERHRSVYRRWKEKSAPGPNSYGAARALQAHPNRAKIIEENPKITTRQARKLAQEHRRQANSEKRGWSPEDARRWLNEVSKHATQFLQHAGFGDSRWSSPFGDVDSELVRQVMKETIQPSFLETLQQAGEACLQLKKKLEEMVRA